MSGAIAAAALVEEKVLRRFREAGAVSPSKTISLTEFDGLEKRMVERLAKKGVIVESKSGDWFLDEQAMSRIRSQRRIWVIVSIFLLSTVALLIYLLNR